MSAMAPIPKMVLDNTMGAQLIGVLLSAVFYGVSCIQTWYYFGWYPNDRWHLRSLVAVCWMFDTTHQALITHTIYIYLVKNFNDPAKLGTLVWSLLVEVLFNGLIALLVQSFYAFRIYRLSGRNILLTSVVASLIIGEFVSVVVYTVKSLQLATFEELAGLKHLSMVVNVLAAAGDVLIAGVLCTMLHVSRTGFKKSDTMINKLIMFIVNTGLLTSVCAVMSLVSIVVWPNAFIYICFYFMLVYSNSLLAMLNARKSIRGENCDTEGFSLTMPTFPATSSYGGESRTARNKSLTVMVETTKECVGDDRFEFAVKSGSHGFRDRDHDSQISSEMLETPEDSPKMSLPMDKDIVKHDGDHSKVDLVRRMHDLA